MAKYETNASYRDKCFRGALRRSPGTGSVYRPAYRSASGEPRKGRLYWIRYRVGGQTKLEATKTANRQDAERLLRQRLARVDRGEASLPVAERTTFEDLRVLIWDDYAVNGRRSLTRVNQALVHLQSHFAATRAATWDLERVQGYTSDRLEDGAARATVNYELAILKRMLRLGHRLGRVDRLPYIPMLANQNARTGFFEKDTLGALLQALPPDLRPPVRVAYLTGWRLPSEILSRQWHHVDLKAGWLRLEPGETKSGEGRMFPLIPALLTVLRAQRKATTALELQLGHNVATVFHTATGSPLFYRTDRWQVSTYFRKGWKEAVTEAGLEGRIPHDFRRSATRNLLRAGVSLPAVMKMVGWETTAMLRRYAIADESMLREAGEKLARLR